MYAFWHPLLVKYVRFLEKHATFVIKFSLALAIVSGLSVPDFYF